MFNDATNVLKQKVKLGVDFDKWGLIKKAGVDFENWGLIRKSGVDFTEMGVDNKVGGRVRLIHLNLRLCVIRAFLFGKGGT